MALTLPYPSMSFVPLDVLTAAEQNQLVANIEYIAANTALAPIASTDINWASTKTDFSDKKTASVSSTLRAWARTYGPFVYLNINVYLNSSAPGSINLFTGLPSELCPPSSDGLATLSVAGAGVPVRAYLVSTGTLVVETSSTVPQGGPINITGFFIKQ